MPKDYEKIISMIMAKTSRNMKVSTNSSTSLRLTLTWSPSTDKNNNPNVPDLMPITPNRAMSDNS